MKSSKTKLTTRQSIFVKEIAKGSTQRQACITAYPNSKNWSINTVDARASALMRNDTVKLALLDIDKEKNNQVLLTKEKMAMKILEIVDLAEAEQEKIQIAYYKGLKIKEQKIKDLQDQWLLANTDKEHLQIEKAILEAKQDVLKHQQKNPIRLDLTNTILRGLSMLCRMYGWKDLGWENCVKEDEKEKSLTAEELIKLANEITQKERKKI